VETFNNENDQVDALKRFFAENGKALAVGVILGIGALVGWRYWTSHQQDTARDASGLRTGDFRAEIEYARSAVRGGEIRG
jgi:predicted negative regulator of RcsB-dependent stress response